MDRYTTRYWYLDRCLGGNMALTVANMVTRVKRIGPIYHDGYGTSGCYHREDELSCLLDVFPFQEKYQTATLSSGDYKIATPDNLQFRRTCPLEEWDEYDVANNGCFHLLQRYFQTRCGGWGLPSILLLQGSWRWNMVQLPASEAIPLRNGLYAILMMLRMSTSLSWQNLPNLPW